MSLAPGARLGPYEILALLGAGGMGEVYKAIDTRLGRTVAIKILRGEHTDRFQREARAIAALNHRHICALYDIGPDYLVMEYLEGAPVRGPLPVEQALRLGLEIAAALEEAHRKGIIHRDLKPGNILISSDGAKLLDFGLAKLEHTSQSDATVTETQAGTVLGTAAYMSPEQAEGRSADARSDIFSFGAVLYEMVCGLRAFSGETGIAVMASILREEPKPLRDVPAELERSVARCLRKDPTRRFQSMAEVKIALEDALSAAVKKEETPSIAVLPFANLSADKENEYFSDGITESIINSLAHIAQLRVASRSAVFRYKGKDMDPQAVAKELKVQAVLTGILTQRGDGLSISVELIKGQDNSQIWGQQYNRKLADVFAVQEEMAKEISQKLRLKLTGAERQQLAKRPTENVQAFQYYMQGRVYTQRRTREDLLTAVRLYERAIEEDRNYALAQAGLADAYSNLGLRSYIAPNEGRRKAEEAARKALELDQNLAEAHAALGYAYTVLGPYDFLLGDRELRRAIDLSPSFALAHFYLGNSFLRQGRIDEGLDEYSKARELDPLSPIIARAAATPYYLKRDFVRALELLRKANELGPPFSITWEIEAYIQNGLFDEALAELEKARRDRKNDPILIYSTGMVYAAQRMRPEALGVIKELEDMSGASLSQAHWIAKIYATLNEKELALSWLERGFAKGEIGVFYKDELVWDGIRRDPRFAELLRQMRIPT